MTSQVASRFETVFGIAPMATGRAHGRANLIGDHTDYNDGFVLPTLLSHATNVAIGLREDAVICGHSDQFGMAERQVESPCDGGWLDFVSGAMAVLVPFGGTVGGINITVESTVPSGAGVSSSAALELAVLRALSTAQGLAAIAPSDLALAAQKIEHDFIGTQCGIMDQMVCAVASPGEAMHLDCRSLETNRLRLFPEHCFVVIHTGSSRKLSEGLYNTRLGECRKAAAAMNVSALRDATLDDIPVDLPLTESARARHVIAENARVGAAVDALRNGDAGRFGRLMTDSHRSLAEDYEVSSETLDRLVDVQLANGALGARLTGAGFGGCTVALCQQDDVEPMLAAVTAACDGAYLVDVVKPASG